MGDWLSANYDKCVLKIDLPTNAEAEPKQIKVTVGTDKVLEAKVHSKTA